ncbi:Cytochrome c oxidase subunit 6C [Melipona quadrifasciata]|uniref:Cytochrome c oxidase subunit 6C n=1 Tax=Melipona quadrifasciata TaxID=166423 RepID=A0A0M9A351_9HYME|nr:Cytochrome c oxidase subunit 6C [Melipona quadrifasciata]
MSEKRLPKPQLRGLHVTRIKRSFAIAGLLCATTGMAWKLLVIDTYNQKVEDFYKTYDAEKSLDRMNKAGLMESYQ